VSSHSAQSQWLGFEVGVAAGLGKKLLSVVVGNVQSQLPPALKSLQSIKVDKFPQYVAKLSHRLRT
jgi:hypothetical protein